MGKQQTIVVALGGNSILRATEKGSVEEQFANLKTTCCELLGILDGDKRIVITHGNGPQVGNLLLAVEHAKDVVPPLSLDVCGAATQGFMGYMIQQTLANSLRDAGMPHNITTVITQVIVDRDDPAFKNPSKPVGPFYKLDEAEKFRRDKGWIMIEDASRGYRRVVPSPRPIAIQQARIIKSMLDAGEIVIAVGGGGIPSVRGPNRELLGVEAVIDKDYASGRLAAEIDADTFIILTAVEKVFKDFKQPGEKALDHLTAVEAKQLLAEGHFGKGSMEPKIQAAIDFLESPVNSSSVGRNVIITLPETATAALQGKTGTRITLH